MKTDLPEFDEKEQATLSLFASMAKEAHGYVYYESKVTRKSIKGGATKTIVEIREKYRAPQGKAAKLLEQQGVEVKWVVDKKQRA